MQQNWSAMLSGMAEANEKAVAAATEFNRIAARTQSQVARRQLAAFEDWLDAGSRCLELVTGGTDPQETMKRQAQVAVELGEKLVAAGQETMEIQVQARDELMRWMEKGVQTATSEAQSALKSIEAAPRPAARRTSKKAAA